jgi:hypothetical protein
MRFYVNTKVKELGERKVKLEKSLQDFFGENFSEITFEIAKTEDLMGEGRENYLKIKCMSSSMRFYVNTKVKELEGFLEEKMGEKYFVKVVLIQFLQENN